MQKILIPSQKIPSYSVSELNRQVKNLLEVSFMRISVTGEISNLSIPRSGHWYFSLKDEHAQVRCAMFRSANIKLQQPPSNGDMVIVKARVSLYEGRGEFQLIVDHLETAGTGALLLAYEELKRKLSAEGLFDSSRKLGLPALPTRIGVITSATGAAVRDILTVLKRRFSAIPVLIFPVSVQGQEAAPALTHAVNRANQFGNCDVIIIARGGGSLEDLWAFNDEELARAIAASEIPVISAIGHETDYTICDLVADLRAATPSAAAEKVSPNSAEFFQRFDDYERRLGNAFKRQLTALNQRTGELGSRLKHPVKRLEEMSQRLDDAELQLLRLTRRLLTLKQNQCQQLTDRLQRQHPLRVINHYREHLQNTRLRLEANTRAILTNKSSQLVLLTEVMQSVSPLATLARGYSITTNSRGEILSRFNNISQGEEVHTKLMQGEIVSVVKSIKSLNR